MHLTSSRSHGVQDAEDTSSLNLKSGGSGPKASVATPSPLLSTRTVEIQSGNTTSISDCLEDKDLSPADLSLTSSDPEVVEVCNDGTILGMTPGKAHISIEAPGRTDRLQVHVTPPPGISLGAQYLQLKPGATGTLDCAVYGVEDEARWTTDDENVATVDASGTVTGVQPGVAWLTVRAGKYSAEAPVWVTESEPLAPLPEMGEPRYAVDTGGVLQDEDAPDTQTATILLTGDMMALSAQQQAARTGETYNFNSSFGLVRPIFEKGDLVVGNLETCLSYSQPYTIQQKTLQGNPHCNAPATYLDAVRCAGYDAVVTANNHSGDTGLVGLLETIQQLDTYQLAHTGTYASAQQPRFVLADVNGIRVALLSYTELLNTKGGELALPEDRESAILSRYSPDKVQADVRAARAAGAEYVIAYNHWGSENTHQYTDRQMQHAREMADAGVDFIAGSHSHCLQPPVMLTAEDGRDVPCIFSLGNFVSSMGREINNDTVILRVELSRQGNEIVVKSLGYIPCHVSAAFAGGHHVVVPLSPALGGTENQGARSRISSVMGSDVFEEITTMEEL